MTSKLKIFLGPLLFFLQHRCSFLRVKMGSLAACAVIKTTDYLNYINLAWKMSCYSLIFLETSRYSKTNIITRFQFIQNEDRCLCSSKVRDTNGDYCWGLLHWSCELCCVTRLVCQREYKHCPLLSQSAHPMSLNLCSTLPVSRAPLIRPTTPYTCGSTCLSSILAAFKPASVISSVSLFSYQTFKRSFPDWSPVADLPASSLPWILPQSSVSNHKFPPVLCLLGSAATRLFNGPVYKLSHYQFTTCLPVLRLGSNHTLDNSK